MLNPACAANSASEGGSVAPSMRRQAAAMRTAVASVVSGTAGMRLRGMRAL